MALLEANRSDAPLAAEEYKNVNRDIEKVDLFLSYCTSGLCAKQRLRKSFLNSYIQKMVDASSTTSIESDDKPTS